MKRFRSGETKLLFTTDVLARSTDVPNIKIVINFDLPYSANQEICQKQYLHRISRSGRMGKAGMAITFLDNESQPKYAKLANDLNFQANQLYFNNQD